jgi:AraC-like DNA-binding protein/GAF domain-containing protein
MNQLNASACLCVLDQAGEILFVSQGWKVFFAQNKSPSVSGFEAGMNINELKSHSAADPAALIQLGALSVLTGGRQEFSAEYSDSSREPGTRRLTRIEITPLQSFIEGCQIVAMDVTERRKPDQDTEFFTKLEQLTSRASLRLTACPSAEIDKNIETSLQEVCQIAGVGYAFLTKIHQHPDGEHQAFSMTHYWHPTAPEDFETWFQNVPAQNNPFREKLLSNQSSFFTYAEDLPDQFQDYRSRCLALGVKSVATVPIFVEGEFYGYVGVVTLQAPREWTKREIMILRVLSEIFGAAFLRQRIENSLREREKCLLAFYRETEYPVWCFSFNSPIPIHLPVEKQFEMMIKSSHLEDCNDAHVRLVGKSSKDQLLQRSPDAIFGNASEAFGEFLRNFILDGYRSVNARTEIRFQEESVRIWLNQAQGVVEDGKLIRVWGSTRDITESAEIEELSLKATHYKNSSLTSDEIQERVGLIEKAMKHEQPYLDPNFNLTKLSKLVRVPDYQLSQVLNMGMKTNFYDLVNRFRIERLIDLWSDPSRDEFSILDLAFEVGFNSKSTFNTAFKKITGKTPSTYRTQLQLQRGRS